MMIHTQNASKYASPVYLRHLPYWRFLRASYLGGREWYDQGETKVHTFDRDPTNPTHKEWSMQEQAYLARHAREPDEFYELRFRSSVYWNLTRPLVDGMVSAVVKNARTTELPAALSYLSTNVDGDGTDISDFDFTTCRDLVLYGAVHHLVEKAKPAIEYNVQSIADEGDLGMVPLARVVSPIDLIRWQRDPRNTEYEWCILRKRVPERIPALIDGSESGDTKPVRYHYCYVTPDEWVEYDENGTEIPGTRRPGYGFVPLVTTVLAQHPKEADPIGVSAVEDVVELAKLVYNKSSWLTEEQRNSCFNQKFLKGGSPLDRKDSVKFGSLTYIGGYEDFKFVAPDIAPMQHLEESVRSDVNMRAPSMLGLEAGASDAEGVKSGIAIALEQEKTVATLSGLAKHFETAKRAVLRMAAQVAGANQDEVKVRVDRDFSPLAAAGRNTAILEAIKNGSLVPEAKAALQKELLVSLLPNIAPDEREAIAAAIDAGIAEQEAMREAAMAAMSAQDEDEPEDDDHGTDHEQGGPKKHAPPFAMKRPAVQ